MKNKKMNGFWGLVVLFLVAFVGFSTTANAQYVGKQLAIERIKKDINSEGGSKVGGSGIETKKVPASLSPEDYSTLLRKTYLQTLLRQVVEYGNVATAIEVNNNDWVQKTTGNPKRSASLPLLKNYVINLLKS